VDTRIEGPRAHIPHPHPTRHCAQQVDTNDLLLRRRRLLRRRPRARPGKTPGPQDHVPDHLVVGRQRAPQRLRPPPPAQQSRPLRAAERTPQLPGVNSVTCMT